MARRKEVRLPADWICDSPAVTALSCAEFGVLTWLIAEKQRWFPEGRFIEEGRVFSLRMLAERSPHRGGGALGCLHGLQSAGFLIREADGVFRLVEKWRQEEAEDAGDEPVLSKVHDGFPPFPYNPYPPRKYKEREAAPSGRGRQDPSGRTSEGARLASGLVGLGQACPGSPTAFERQARPGHKCPEVDALVSWIRKDRPASQRMHHAWFQRHRPAQVLSEAGCLQPTIPNSCGCA